MPLIQSKSKKALQKNIETEMDANTSPENRAQNLAIAYSIKRKNSKKMAKGGPVSAQNESRPMPDQTFNDAADARRSSAKKKLSGDSVSNRLSDQLTSKKSPSTEIDEDFSTEDKATANNAGTSEEMNMHQESSNDPLGVNAEHGEDDEDALLMAQGGEVEDHYESIADAILSKKRKVKQMSDGGQVDLEANSRESNNVEDDLSFNALLKEQYDDSQLSRQPMNSNEHSPEHDEVDVNDRSLVGQIRRKIKR